MEKKKSGIQRRYLRYTIALLGLALLLSSLGVGICVKVRLTNTVIDKYEFMTERMGLTLENLFQQSDEATAECILDEDVQQSLRNRGMEEVSHIALSKYFAYADLEHIADYCYMDNKGNVYSKSYTDVTSQDIKDSGFEDYLSGEYAKTTWFWTKDTLFGTGEEALFIGRYVRSKDYHHEPGMLFFKMDAMFLQEVTGMGQELTDEAEVGIVDVNGNFCLSSLPEGTQMGEERQKEIGFRIDGDMEAGMFLEGERIEGGALSAYRDPDSGLVVFSFIPNRVLNQGLFPVLAALGLIYLLVIAVAVVLSIYFSRRFTRPIREIQAAMTEFDGTRFDRTIELHTNTELDEIGHSYNEMLRNIEKLLEEIKSQERELRTSELNMLISQINPHFLYNTLDTIYMLARINKEETTMRMIQALSKYLRLSLSKGEDIVTVEDELENVKSYMEIQQIRNENLFAYEIDCQVDGAHTWVLKLILQPLVENAVKYGFQDIFEGGLIRIEVWMEDKFLCLSVYNSGTPIETAMETRINGMKEMQLSELKGCFPDRGQGYGVVNIVTRLRLKYGDETVFCCRAEENGTKFTIKIPGGGRRKEDEQ